MLSWYYWVVCVGGRRANDVVALINITDCHMVLALVLCTTRGKSLSIVVERWHVFWTLASYADSSDGLGFGGDDTFAPTE